METMADRIRQLRQARGLSQDALAELCGVTKSAVSQWESGATANIKLRFFLDLCAALKTDPHYLIYGPDRGQTSGSDKTRTRQTKGGAA